MVYFFHRGDTIFLLGAYVPNGKTKIIEAIVDKTWENGKVRAYTKGNEPGEWKFNQNSFRRCVFYTHEEAEKALRREEKQMNEIKTGDIWKHKFFNFEVKVKKVIDNDIHVLKNKKKMEIYKPAFLENYEFVKNKTKEEK